MRFSWFPGHMRKALRELKERIPLADLVIFMMDARIPQSSINPELEKYASNKRILYVMNKTDLASPSVTSSWVRYFREEGKSVVAVSSKKTKSLKPLSDKIDEIRGEIVEARSRKGRIDSMVRAVAVGIPNSGKQAGGKGCRPSGEKGRAYEVSPVASRRKESGDSGHAGHFLPASFRR